MGLKPFGKLTVLDIKRIRGQSKSRAAVVALETAAMEELPLGTQPFHHVHAFSAEETNIAASDVDREFFPERALQGKKY